MMDVLWTAGNSASIDAAFSSPPPPANNISLALLTSCQITTRPCKRRLLQRGTCADRAMAYTVDISVLAGVAACMAHAFTGSAGM